jgi:hypothetical protein
MTYKEMQIGKTYYKKFVEDKGRSGLKREKTYHKSLCIAEERGYTRSTCFNQWLTPGMVWEV